MFALFVAVLAGANGIKYNLHYDDDGNVNISFLKKKHKIKMNERVKQRDIRKITPQFHFTLNVMH